ncbi:MAG: ribosome recycling factor [Patescibacteria group bacterium]|nr:ribosome recycling factor [Patescibacteria group bacterium]
MRQSIEKIKPEFEKVINYFKSELQKVRSGKASANLVEDIVVDCFGSRLPLKQLATISCPEPRQLLIQPWSAEYLEGIDKALQQADLGTSPTNDGQVIRINLPPVTGEFREKLIAQISAKGEESYQSLRRWRDQAWKEIQDKLQKKEISEDDKFKGKDELQDLIEEYHKKIEDLKEKKKEEILS